MVRIRLGKQVYIVQKNLKNKSLKSRFGWKNGKINIFFNRACARGGKFFSYYSQLMRRGDFFKVVRVTIEIQVSEVQKEKLKNVWRLGLGRINEFF